MELQTCIPIPHLPPGLQVTGLLTTGVSCVSHSQNNFYQHLCEFPLYTLPESNRSHHQYKVVYVLLYSK